MFFACLECFGVMDEWPPVEDTGVVPVVCSTCRSGLAGQEAASPRRKEPYGAVFTGLRVLVVDDDLSVSSLLKRRLQLWGCMVEEATNGNEGVEKYLRRVDIACRRARKGEHAIGGPAVVQQVLATDLAHAHRPHRVTQGRGDQVPAVGQGKESIV